MEGTILTVCREASEYLTKVYNDSFTIEDCLKAYLEEGYRSLERTPEILPVLKQAGVVDAGAKGLLTIVEGMLAGLNGQNDFAEENKQEAAAENEFAEFHIHPDQITFQYCTEVIVRSTEGRQVDVEAARAYLETLGDCVLVVGAGCACGTCCKPFAVTELDVVSASFALYLNEAYHHLQVVVRANALFRAKLVNDRCCSYLNSCLIVVNQTTL